MPQSSSPAIVNIPLAAPSLRLLLLVPIILAVLGGWFSVRWYLGNTIAEVATTSDTPNIELARVGGRWAPADPFVHWRLGVISERDFSVNNLADTVREFEAAVRLSPNDFRYWDELGRALESSGNSAAAEIALRRATELSPYYAYPRWHFGNALLRNGKLAEAFPQLFQAAQANPQLWPQVLNLAWQAYDQDVDRIANEACKEPSVRTMFATFLVGAKKFDDAVRLWKTLSPDQRAQLKAGGEELRTALLGARQFRAAFEITQDIDKDRVELPVADQFLNGSFEKSLVIPSAQVFGWTISSSAAAQVSINSQAHSGQHGLRVVFSAPNKLDRINAQQSIVVQPNTQYHFECYVRTEKLNTASTPVILVLDAADSNPLATSPPAPSGTNEWQKLSVDFKTKNSDAITIIIGRLPCSVGDVCPIFGTVWYDDFILKR
jgi:carbohydrate binding protein with CBM4/9 domain/tetratricopeptide repeat protein